ncbi:MAG: hypothetical protein IJQ73_03105 [Kiritimatiellae bacterium]|nr:hypothetical protein [Kiritimatiellia bacterium]
MMERKKALGIRLGLALALSLLGASAAQGRDWVDFTVAGCKVEADDPPLTNFPVAVRISAARIKGFRYSDIASPDDLLFSSTESKAPYPFEVETWNPDGESVVWVRLPLVCTNTQFRMSFNLPPNRPANPDSTNVWSAANYRAVWHMNEYDAEVLKQSDSSGNGFAATYTVSSKCGLTTSSAIGKAFYRTLDKNTVEQCATTPNLTSTIKMNWNGATLSGWAYYKEYAASGEKHLIWINTSSTGSYYWGLSTKSKTVRSKFGTATSSIIGAGLNPASGWFHWALRVTNKTSYQYYLNGELLQSLTKDAKYSTQSTTSEWSCGGNTGYLDEFRYRNASSSEDWIRAEYDSVKNKDFVIAGPVHRGGKLILYVQ